MQDLSELSLYQKVLDTLPTPVLIKDNSLRYVFVNLAFETLFQVDRSDILGELDSNVFKQRQVAQCNSGDLRVLATGEVDESYETVFDQSGKSREVITRKIRLIMPSGDTYLVGTIHDITEVSTINRQLINNQTELTFKSEALELMAHTDPLTGCSNRRALDSKLPGLFKNADYTGGLIAIDVDHFKAVNDNYGHSVGDAVLKQLVNIITQVIASDHELLRTGGEEFLIACAGLDQTSTLELAETIRKSVENTGLEITNTTLFITVSIGVSYADVLPKWDLDKLINITDKGLYKAKQQGRNCVVEMTEG